jgi:hypothetical protein
MKYEKPSAVVIASATVAIQGTGKGSNAAVDSQWEHTTSSAYQADE